MTAETQLIVTGAQGRIGRLLRKLWADRPPSGLSPLWLTRKEWDIGQGPPPEVPSGGVLLDLAGVTSGDFERNPFLASKVADFSQQLGCKLIYVSSAAVYPGGAMDMDEDRALAPVSAYGRSKVAAEVTVRAVASNPTILRLGNVAGADALLAGNRPGLMVTLDQTTLGNRGPVRSYIGPHVLAEVLSVICSKAIAAKDIGHTLNVAQPHPVAMADLLDAAGYDWSFRDPHDGVIDKVALSLDRLQELTPVPAATASSLVADLRQLGCWP